MLRDLLMQNEQRIASAAEEEISVAHSRGKDVYFEDMHEEGSVVRERPDGRVEKIRPKKDFAA